MEEKETKTTEPMTRRAHRKLRRKGQVPFEQPTNQPVADVESKTEGKKRQGIFRRERAKNRELQTTRSEEQEKTAELGRFLNKAILGVTILLIIVFIAIFYF